MNFSRIIALALGALIMVAVVWFFHWTAGSPPMVADAQADYYNLLVDGFEKGSLAMDVSVTTPNGPDAPVPFLLDASYYDGKYYLYFGVTPALLLFWPWRLFTGQDLPIAAAGVIWASMAFAFSVGWLVALRRRVAAGVPGWYWLAAVAALGIAAGYPVVLRRPLFYEVAILANIAFTMAGLWCLTMVWLRSEKPLRWLAAASLCAGLAIGSRPTVGPGALLALGAVAIWVCWQRRRVKPEASAGCLLRVGIAAGGPVVLCLTALAWYNWARFGNPIEFGLSYQQGSNPDGFSFTLGSLGKNLQLYYLTPPSVGWYFPFFAPGDNPAGINREQVHGQFLFLPLMAMAVAAFVFSRRQGLASSVADFRLPFLAGALWAGVTMVIECMAPPHANRYQLDFHPVFLLLTLMTIAAALPQIGWRRTGPLAVAWLLVLLVFNLCTSLHVHGFFEGSNPREYGKLARIINRDFVWPVQRLLGAEPGGVELMVRFPPGKPGEWEPLLVTGGGPDMDALFIEYTGLGRGRLVFDHLDYGAARSVEFDLQPGRARWLKVYHGGLFPPADHPWYRLQPEGAARARHRLAVEIDGKSVIDRDMVFYQASSNQIVLGRRARYLKGAERFTGQIAQVRTLKVPADWLNNVRQSTGPVRVRLQLPQDRYGATEPLLISGTGERFDLVSITYLDERRIQFSLLHAGWSERLHSPPLAWDYRQPVELMLHHAALGGPDVSGLHIAMEDEVVWQCELPPYPADATQVYVACLPWPVTGCARKFGGDVLSVARGVDEPGPMRRAIRGLLAGKPVSLRFTWPAIQPAAGLPLVSTGATGIGDGIFIEPLPDGRVRFGFDHWGSQPLVSAPTKLEPLQAYTVTISFGTKLSALETVRAQLQLQLDGATLIDASVDVFPCNASTTWLGENRPGLSTSGPRFQGEISVVDEWSRP